MKTLQSVSSKSEGHIVAFDFASRGLFNNSNFRLRLIIVNYACAFGQSESGKYFEGIMMLLIDYYRFISIVSDFGNQ